MVSERKRVEKRERDAKGEEEERRRKRAEITISSRAEIQPTI